MEQEKVKYLIDMINNMDIKDKLRLAICTSQNLWKWKRQNKIKWHYTYLIVFFKDLSIFIKVNTKLLNIEK